ncbi:hypothetical protein M409DRAFT_53145 [Zasmidium cellare ATCC 36951]|uniref:Uncharacterized protein n=1 Tax=Zasmidium cellare ATCC 36951 TaxID=1080233 RepID=A0A6A6CRL9_ZASCE|nr:uncharacterized protein M409DRAFT_53145 [Zasmidium cellare ATCC 36951]KAF2168472.1 hypothetical protein M409DRAFT_53145 [Zasmidium cellare ATCC 36951]
MRESARRLRPKLRALLANHEFRERDPETKTSRLRPSIVGPAQHVVLTSADANAVDWPRCRGIIAQNTPQPGFCPGETFPAERADARTSVSTASRQSTPDRTHSVAPACQAVRARCLAAHALRGQKQCFATIWARLAVLPGASANAASRKQHVTLRRRQTLP